MDLIKAIVNLVALSARETMSRKCKQQSKFIFLCGMNKGWKCAFPAMLCSVHYFLCELSLASSYENGHPWVVRDIFHKRRLTHMKASFFPTAGKGCWIHACSHQISSLIPLVSHVYFHHGRLVLFIWTPGLGTSPSSALHPWGISVSYLLLGHMYWWWFQQCCPHYQGLPQASHRSCLCL